MYRDITSSSTIRVWPVTVGSCVCTVYKINNISIMLAATRVFCDHIRGGARAN